jgi:outer membrane biosynthesis protein TonB
MYFDFDDYHRDFVPVGRAISWREGFLLSVIFHLLVIIGVLNMPALPAQEVVVRPSDRLAAVQRQREREAQRFVFVQPRLDVEAPRPPERGELSDKNRIARAPERAERPTNALPFSRGNSPERVEALRNAPPPPPPAEEPTSPAGPGKGGEEASPGAPSAGSASGLTWPGARGGAGGAAGTGNSGVQGPGGGESGLLGNSLRTLQRYIQQEESFDNPGGGGGQFGPSIQFDTKGVEFGPWIRRFIAQIKRNWFIPYAAMAMRGHVVTSFYVLKSGEIIGLSVPGPSSVDAFNNAAYNALAASSPTQPLPAEYPSDRAYFVVTFYYNETPPIQ